MHSLSSLKQAAALLGLAATLVASACQPPAVFPRPAPPVTTHTALPTSAPTPTATVLPLPSATAVAAPQPPVAPPTPSLFETSWSDRSVFGRGLVSSEQAVLDQRLGASVYHIDLAIADDQTRVEGRQEVLYTNSEDVPLDEIVFRLFPNLTGGGTTVSQVTVNGQALEPRLEQRDSVLVVPLSRPLQPGEQVVLGMDFDVTVPTDPEGSNYGTFAYLRDVLALAHIYPMVAVYDDEGWNTEIAPPEGDVVYADSSYYRVRITAPETLTLVTSGVTLDRQAADGKQVLDVVAGPARDFYLAASNRYRVISETVGETTVNSYAPAKLRSGAEETLSVAKAALADYSRRFGPYPYTEFDIVSTATTALGVEYPGMTALNDKMYAEDMQQFLEGTTAHEVAHQWFYNLVGNDQVDEPWLDEALTQYATWLYFGDRYGPAGEQGFEESLSGRWEGGGEQDKPIGLPVEAYADGSYSAIVYGRGPFFFAALQEEMGQEIFDRFLDDYVTTFAWDIASTEGLRSLAEQHCACDLGSLFEEWVYPRQ